MHRWMGVLVPVALAGLACDSGWLHQRGLRVIREIGVGESARLLEDPATVMIQVRGPEWTGLRVQGTRLLDAQDDLPARLGERVVILADDPLEAMRMAARLSRAGIQEVAVVRGGVAAWLAARREPGPRPAAAAEFGEAT